MPDQRVRRVRRTDGGVAGQRARADRDVRDLVQGEQSARQVPGADDRPGQDERGEFVAVALGEPGGDQTAHGVADQDEGDVRVCGPCQVGDAVQVRDHVLEVLDQHPLTGRRAVPLVVGAEDRRAVRAQYGGQLGVPADVFAVAVCDEGEVARMFVRPLVCGDLAPGAGEGVLAGVVHTRKTSTAHRVSRPAVVWCKGQLSRHSLREEM